MKDPTAEVDIRKLIEAWANAVCRGDIEGVLKDHLDDLVMFDVPEPASQRGLAAYRLTWDVFFRHNPPGPQRFVIEKLSVSAGTEVAFAHGLLRIGSGEPRCRLTLGLRRVDGRWQVSHEHHSMPIQIG
jgi:ketosteroid isomerase-like protein